MGTVMDMNTATVRSTDTAMDMHTVMDTVMHKDTDTVTDIVMHTVTDTVKHTVMDSADRQQQQRSTHLDTTRQVTRQILVRSQAMYIITHL